MASTETRCGTSGAANPGTIGEFASRLTGSSDLYESSGRRPYGSINFITGHDGFTLHDLVSYNHKHNQANAATSEAEAESIHLTTQPEVVPTVA